MKIRIENQIIDIDENTFSEWMKSRCIPPNASIFVDDQWLRIGDLEDFQQPKAAENQPVTNGLQDEASERDSHSEKEFPASRRNRAMVTLSLIAANTIVFLLLDWEAIRGSRHALTLIQFGAYSHRLVVYDGEYWRLITHTFLHGGSLHLLLNMGVLFIVGNLLERLYGGSRFLVLYLISAIGGSLATLYFVRDAPSVGASGAIFGLMGALVALGLRHKDRLPRGRNRVFVFGLLPFIAIDILLGFIIPHINNAAHLGGLGVGFAAGLVLTPGINAKRPTQPKAVQALASGLTGMVLACSALAIWHYFADSEQTIEKRMNTAFPRLSVESLPDYIRRYEKLIRQKGYSPEEYTVLEELYWWAHENSPEDTSWTDKLMLLYENALLADTEKDEWHRHLRALYVKTVFEDSHEIDELKTYIALCEKVANQRGYYLKLYENLQYFYMRARDLVPEKESSSWNRKLELLYGTAIAKDPEYADWHNNLAWLYVEQKMMPQKAVEFARQAVMQAPRKTVFLDTLAWAYLRNAQHDKALKTFEQVFLFASETEDDLHAEESSWKGLTDLVQSEIQSEKSQDFNRSFLNFYKRLSHRLGTDSGAQAKLEAVFTLFQTHQK